MDSPNSRPLELDALIHSYGRYAGIDDLVFDDENLLAFEIDGTEITLQYTDGIAGVVLKSALDLPASKVTASLLIALHAANVSGASNGMGIVGIDHDFGGWIWIDRFDPRGMLAERLHEILNRAVRCIAFWSANIDDLVDRKLSNSGELDVTAVDFPMMRV